MASNKENKRPQSLEQTQSYVTTYGSVPGPTGLKRLQAPQHSPFSPPTSNRASPDYTLKIRKTREDLKTFAASQSPKPVQRRPSVRKRVVSVVRDGILSRSRSTISAFIDNTSPDSSTLTAVEPLRPSPKFSGPSQLSKADAPLGGVSADLLGDLRVELSTFISTDTIDVSQSKTTWVMVKAETTMLLPGSGEIALNHASTGRAPGTKPLDVIVVIDNSPFVSPRSLRSIKLVLSEICRSLNSGDRLAVFCIYCQHSYACQRDTTVGCQIHALNVPDLDSLATEVGRIIPASMGLFKAKLALPDFWDQLVHHIASAGPDGSLKSDIAQVIILSPSPQEHASALQRLKPWRVHQIKMGLYYAAIKENRSNDGWCFEVPLDMADPSSRIDNFSMQRAIATMISQGRTRQRTGLLAHVNMDFTSGADCTIKEVVRQPRSRQLRPGQSMTVLIKVAVPAISDSIEQGEVCSDGLFEELFRMLGESETQLFTTSMSYKHSLRPTTTCTMEDTCTIRRCNTQSVWNRKAEETESGSAAYVIEYAKALFIARTWPPDAALERLGRKFRPAAFDEHEGLTLVREELQFQRAAWEAEMALSSTGLFDDEIAF